MSSYNSINLTNYHAQYPLNAETLPIWTQYWQKIYPSTPLTTTEVQAMTDGFINQVSNQMSTALNHAVAVQKANDQAQQAEDGSSPDPVW